jgi:hypothetical protein
MENRELLKAIEEMTARLEANRKADWEEMLEKIDANMKSMQEDIKANREQRKAERDADQEEWKQEIRAGQECMQEMIRASQENMEAIIQSIRSERDEMIQQRGENVMTRINHETQSLQKACQETMEACLECKEPTSADMKACQKMTVCHEATEIDTEKIQPDPRMMQSIAKHQRSRSDAGRRTEEAV